MKWYSMNIVEIYLILNADASKIGVWWVTKLASTDESQFF